MMLKKMVLWIFVLCLTISFASFVTPSIVYATGTNYYVSTTGNDTTGDGSIGNPWKTIGKAASILAAGDTCIIRGGTYREDSITPTNSGTTGNPITFRAYTGETVVVSGTEEVTSSWTQYSGNIYRTDWALDMETENQVFVDGSMMILARYPNDSDGDPYTLNYATCETGTGYGKIIDSDLTQADDYWNGSRVFYVDGDAHWLWVGEDITDSKNIEIDEDPTYEIDFDVFDSSLIPYSGSQYYINNKKEELDAAKEWWYDSTNEQLYLWVPGGGNPSSSTVEVKIAENVFDLSDKDYITIDGLDIFGAGITGTDTNHCIITNIDAEYLNYSIDLNADYSGLSTCEFYADNATNSRMRGIYLQGDYNEVTNSEISYCAFSAVYMRGSNNKLVNNYIHHINFLGSEGGVGVKGYDFLIANNTFDHSGRFLLETRGLQHSEIKYNIFSNFEEAYTSDYGMISETYCDGWNTEIHHNIFYGSQESYEVGPGIYPDNYSQNYIIHHNIIYDCKNDEAIRDNGPQQYVLWYNNTLIGEECFPAVMADTMLATRWQNNIFTDSFEDDEDFIKSYNIFSGTDPEFNDPDNDDYSLDSGSPARDAGCIIAGITDGYTGDAPDIGALEYGGTDWTSSCGHDFSSPPSPTLSVPTDIPYQNKLKNAGFDEKSAFPTSDGLTGWTKTDAETAVLSSSSSAKMNGKGGFGLQLGSNVDGIEQTITGLLPNTTYILTGWLKSSNGENIRMGVKSFGGDETFEDQTATSFVLKEVVFTTGSSNTTATVYVKKTENGTGYVYANMMGVSEHPYPLMLLDEEWDSLSSYTTSGTTSEISPSGQLHISDNDGDVAEVYRSDIEIPEVYTVEFSAKVDNFLNNTANGEDLGLCVGNGTYRLMFRISSDGLYALTSSNSWTRIKSKTLDNDWHTYKIFVNGNGATVLMDGVEECTFTLQSSAAYEDTVEYWLDGISADACEAHVDWTKVYTYQFQVTLFEEGWNSLTQYTVTGDTAEISPSGQLHLSDNDGDLPDVYRTGYSIPESYTAEFRAKVDNFLDNKANGEDLGLCIGNGTYRLMFRVCSDGLYALTSSDSWTQIKSKTIDNNWHIYRIEVNGNSGTVFMDGTEECTFTLQSSSAYNGTIEHWLDGISSDACEAHVDWTKVYKDAVLETDWDNTTNFVITGTTAEISPSGQLHLSDNDGDLIEIYDSSVFVPEIYTAEFSAKVDNFLNNTANGEDLGLCVGNGTYRLMFRICSDGLYAITNTNNWTQIKSKTIDNNWHTYKIIVDGSGGTVFMDGTQECTFTLQSSSAQAGTVGYWMDGISADACEAHIDWTKVY